MTALAPRLPMQLPLSGQQLSLLQQEYWLLQASVYDDEQQQQIRWAIAYSWQKFVVSFIEKNQFHRYNQRDDLISEGLLGAYQATLRYRPNGSWPNCVFWGIRKNVFACMHRNQTLLSLPSRAVTDYLRVNRYASKHNVSLPQAAAALGLSAGYNQSLQQSCNKSGWLSVGPTIDDEHVQIPADICETDLIDALDVGTTDVSAALTSLHPTDHQALTREYGLGGRPRRRSTVIAAERRIDHDTYLQTLDEAHDALRQLLPSGRVQASDLQRRAYDLRLSTRLLWREIAEILGLSDATAAHRAAYYYAKHHHHKAPTTEEEDRTTDTAIATSEDCYRLAAQGHDWSEVARLAFVDSASTARSHARSFAYRCRNATSALAKIGFEA